MDRKRLVELSIEALERKRADIDAEIEILRTELGTSRPAVRQAGYTAPGGLGRRRPRSAAERKAQSQKMKEYWAQRKGQAPKTSAAARKPAGGQVRVWTAAEKKALGLRMREVWKKRKEAQKNKK